MSWSLGKEKKWEETTGSNAYYNAYFYNLKNSINYEIKFNYSNVGLLYGGGHTLFLNLPSHSTQYSCSKNESVLFLPKHAANVG